MDEWIDTTKEIKVVREFPVPQTITLDGREYHWSPEANAYVGYGPGGDMVQIRFNPEG